MPQFKVLADKVWHSGECRHYHKGDVITLPDSVVIKEGNATLEPIKATKAAKAKDAPEGGKPEGDALA